ncbi:MAG: phage major capsid protein, partial [Lachnospiraceae bacterium]|nr:phage major capsid protein [Lachnospiraceae bacterium]
NIQLPNSVSSEILQKTQEASAIMRLARKVTLPGNGVQIPMITGDPEAQWVTETGSKPVSNPTLDKKIMQAHKLAVIVPFSNEFRRDAAALYSALVSRLPGVLAKKFDATVFFGPESSLANFDDLSAVTAQSLQSSVYGGLVNADTDISEQGGTINGYAFSPQGRGMLLGALDGVNRPLFINSIADSDIPKLLGAATYFTQGAYKAGSAAVGSTPAVPDVVGFAGDWTHAMWGTVEGVKIDVSDQASLAYKDSLNQDATLNLWQQNMFAVRAEIEVGFVAETQYFNALTRTHV